MMVSQTVHRSLTHSHIFLLDVQGPSQKRPLWRGRSTNCQSVTQQISQSVSYSVSQSIDNVLIHTFLSLASRAPPKGLSWRVKLTTSRSVSQTITLSISQSVNQSVRELIDNGSVRLVINRFKPKSNLILTQSCDLISRYGKPVELVNKITSRPIS